MSPKVAPIARSLRPCSSACGRSALTSRTKDPRTKLGVPNCGRGRRRVTPSRIRARQDAGSPNVRAPTCPYGARMGKDAGIDRIDTYFAGVDNQPARDGVRQLSCRGSCAELDSPMPPSRRRSHSATPSPRRSIRLARRRGSTPRCVGMATWWPACRPTRAITRRGPTSPASRRWSSTIAFGRSRFRRSRERLRRRAGDAHDVRFPSDRHRVVAVSYLVLSDEQVEQLNNQFQQARQLFAMRFQRLTGRALAPSEAALRRRDHPAQGADTLMRPQWSERLYAR